ncbi:MAG TPA: phosphodiester glycosidase family protein [Actinomycetota bacterium]|jgi:exopolysaccharide biosynthesis protein|nr:phosphodiester glycosidase family protein [Actinomycetota bacterium]
MAEGWLDAVTDATIWGRVTGEDVDGPVPLRIEVDGLLWGYARAAHRDPDGGPWRLAVAHHLADGQAVSVSALLPGQEPLLLEGSPRRVPASAPPRGRLEAVTATDVVGWAVDDDYDGPMTVALYVDGAFWTRVTADRPRPDLEADGAESGGFSAPHALRPGQQVEALALGVRSDGSRDRNAVVLAGSPATTPEGYLAPGVVHQAITDPAGPFAIHLVSVTLSAPSTIDLALALDVLPGLETTSSMARRRGATVAINGDYADPDHAGRPIHIFAKDGRLLQTAILLGNNHAVDDREVTVFMGRPNVQVVAEAPRTGLVLAVAQVNRGAPAGDEVALFTPEGVTLERPPADATSARLRAAGPATVRADGWAETAYTVEEVGQLGGPVPAGTVVLSTPPAGAAAADLAALAVGDQVTVAWSVATWPGILDTSGGNPTLVRNGRVLSGNVDGTTPFHRRNPRTGVGATADGRLLLVTVDGRQPGHSVGMSLREFAELFVGLGARSAINLDGGGSTTMVLDGTVVNRVSDPQERRVPTAVLVLAGPTPAVPPALPPPAILAPEPDQAAQEADLAAIAADPGSTAGLLGRTPEEG